MRAAAAFLLLALGLAQPAAAGDADLDLIPDSVLDSPAPVAAPAAAASRGRLYLESLPQAGLWRRPLPPPPGRHPDFGHRLALDGRDQFDLAPDWTFTLSDRLNLGHQQGRPLFDRDSVANDLREAFLGWTPADGRYLELGRINQRSGVATGFNPTDFFKGRAVVTRTTEDPGALRENRLGTLMLRGQAVWEGAALTLIGAPGLGDTPQRWWSDRRAIGLGFDRTNRSPRWQAKTSLALAEDLTPELLYYHAEAQNRFGINLTHGFGDRIVAYTEWSGGWRRPLAAEADAELVRNGTVPPGLPATLDVSNQERFLSQLALGFSYAGDHKNSTNFEYHFNQAGLSGDDWRRWIARGRAASAGLAPAGPLWQVRRHAQDQQEPLMRHSLFLRSLWQDALMPDLDLTGMADFSLNDGSSFVQFGANWHSTAQWSFGITLGGFVGPGDSVHGSLPQSATALVSIQRYF